MLRWADKCAGKAYRYLKLDALNACMIADRETALNEFRKRPREFNHALFALAFFSRRQDRELLGAISRIIDGVANWNILPFPLNLVDHWLTHLSANGWLRCR
jgi:hypothetical protein